MAEWKAHLILSAVEGSGPNLGSGNAFTCSSAGATKKPDRSALRGIFVAPRDTRPDRHREIGDSGMLLIGDDGVGQDALAALRADDDDLVAELRLGDVGEVDAGMLQRGIADQRDAVSAHEHFPAMELARASPAPLGMTPMGMAGRIGNGASVINSRR